MSKRFSLGLLAAVLLSTVAVAPPVAADSDKDDEEKDHVSVIVEYNEDGTPAPGDAVIGTSKLKRKDEGLKAKVKVEDLRPGGVYTFWWVVPQGNQVFPGDFFVALGASAVAEDDGRIEVSMEARTGQAGIVGFPPLQGAQFSSLVDPEGSTVRIEIAYHGQADQAGDDLEAWMADFWTGAACPPEMPNPNPAQPHCPVYFAATHTVP